MLPRTIRATLLLAAVAAYAAVPTPREHLGFTPGDDYKLADTVQIFGYFQKLAAASDRIVVRQFGKSSEGKPMYAAFISAPENLKQLDRYQKINRDLALGRAPDGRVLAAQGKVFVWIDSGLHASEVAPAQQAPELAWRMVTGESAELRRIRREVILIQIPVINPDGLDMIAGWYRKNVGTEYELAPLPWLYQKYCGHDNNRDWFMLNLPETRHVTKLLFQEWFPQIVYNQHQAPAFPARIFVPPYAEPLNPNIPAAVMEGINMIGGAIKERLAAEQKTGAISYFGFDGWWNGGLRSVPAFHNMHGILTETAASGYATPKTYKPEDFRATFTSGIPTREPSIFYARPWMGGRWRLRDAVEYMLTVDFAILDLAAGRREEFLYKSWRLARDNMELGGRGGPYAYVVPPTQWDAPTATEMLERLQLAGIEVRRAEAPFRAGSKEYPARTAVLLAGQPFRGYLVDLMEPQKYPEVRGASGAIKRPYDITGWTLPMQMGVTVDRIEQPFEARLRLETQFTATASTPLDHRENGSFVQVADMLARGERVAWTSNGTILAGNAAGQAAFELHRPRVALYQPWIANADQGWTAWVLDRYHVPYTLLHNSDIQKADLRARFDAVILAQQSAASILNGARHGERTRRDNANQDEVVTVQRPEYTGGLGKEGAAHLAGFVKQGGTLIAFDTASEFVIENLPLPVKNVGRAGGGEEAAFYAPGSLIRLTVDTANPLAFGMPAGTIAMTTGGMALSGDGAGLSTVARFAKEKLLASGWVSGEKAVLGASALLQARVGQGRVVLFGFRPQFRGQTYATFKFLLNAIYLASAKTP